MERIVLIGAGNVATSLANALLGKGYQIVQIYSKTIDSAKNLADSIKTSFTDRIDNLILDADIYFVCLPDKVIPDFVVGFPKIEGYIAHTSGSTNIAVFSSIRAKGYGVFYPFQTFTKNRIVPFFDIPICIEGNDPTTFNFLKGVACNLSGNVVEMDSETRTWLHLTGVFTNNFTNHLLAISYKIASEKGFNFGLVRPLMVETIEKAMQTDPNKVQTGPAVRFDQTTINLHVNKLKDYSNELAELYKELSLSIQKFVK